MKAFA
jgi:serine/threonine-protein phosphatase 2A regulatory subunit B'